MAAICLDVGSTFTKAVAVDLATGRLVGATSTPTTVDTDVMRGVDACLEAIRAQVGHPPGPVLASSSAGGGLRIAVVGNEQLITAEAGRHVALSSGGQVVTVLAGRLAEAELTVLEESRPDVVLLVGGTDGGNPVPLVSAARAIVRWHAQRRADACPVVVAGSAEATPLAVEILEAAGLPVASAANVLPRVGVLDPGPARQALRRVFLHHVIGGKHLSSDPRFVSMVAGATPDLVLRGVELLGAARATTSGDLALVDVGGATTDVYSVVHPPQGDGTPAVTRTVEGDLGVRWSAPETVRAAVEVGWVSDSDGALEGARRRRDDPSFVSEAESDRLLDTQLASWAIGVALRRHAGRAQPRYQSTGPSTGRWVERAGVDLRRVRLVLGSGGVLRDAVSRDAQAAEQFVAYVGSSGGWQLPDRPRCQVDLDYVTAAAGLLAEEHPATAEALLWPLGAALRAVDP